MLVRRRLFVLALWFWRVLTRGPSPATRARVHVAASVIQSGFFFPMLCSVVPEGFLWGLIGVTHRMDAVNKTFGLETDCPWHSVQETAGSSAGTVPRQPRVSLFSPLMRLQVGFAHER